MMRPRVGRTLWLVAVALLAGLPSLLAQATVAPPQATVAQAQAPAASPQAASPQATVASPQGTTTPQTMQGPEVERFLREAKIVTLKNIPTGVTHPRKVTLELDGVTRYGVFKTIDENRQGVTTFAGGARPEIDFEDSWKTEVAAYELDKLIGLGMVPATVEREIKGERGSVQLWVDTQKAPDGEQLTETLRLKDKIQPPDVEAWNEQMFKTRLWDNLIYNVDRNTGNVLVTPDWRAVLIDHSRTFRHFAELHEPKGLTRFSRSLLAGIEKLDEPTLNARLSPYLTTWQIKTILQRRDRILALAREVVAKNGESRVLFP